MSLTPSVLALVLVAACAHASWNVLAKRVPDRVVSAAWIGLVYLVGGLLAVPLLARPSLGSVPFLVVSSVLQTAYLLLLVAAYRVGDFGRTYPVARGVSPLVVGLVSVVVLHDHLSRTAALGSLLVCAGLVALALAQGLPRRGSGVGLAVLTGLFIAAYTLVDGVGVRRSGSPLGYAAWLFAVQGLLLVAVAVVRRGRALVPAMAEHARVGTAGGVLSIASYGIVVWAQARTPLTTVSTLREVSVVLAAFLGRWLFRERLGAVRVGASVLVAAGVVALAATS